MNDEQDDGFSDSDSMLACRKFSVFSKDEEFRDVEDDSIREA
jgi:hypothetical protein